MEQKSSGLATASMVLGIIALVSAILGIIPVIGAVFIVIMWICAILGIIFGIIGIFKGGKGKAITGLVLSTVAIFFWWIVFTIIISSF